MKFRRKNASDTPADATPEAAATSAEASAARAPSAPRTDGPHDVADVADDGIERVDLGSVLVPPMEGRELRMQVEEKSGRVQAVLLTGGDGALEFQAFAAPRGGDLWSEVRPQIAADISRRGGTATEREGRFGTELVCAVPVQLPEGKTGTQPSRIIGVNGPRWMLRASLLGRPALDPDNAGEWEDALAQIVVRRGDEARPVGEPLGLELPESARRVG